MNFKEYYNLIKKGFDIAGFLTNPNNSNLKLQDLLDSFESDYGGKVLGGGAFAIVLSHSSWNYVLKIFNDDSCYLKYVRFCMKNQNNKFVPKLLDKPRRITPTYKRRSNQQNLYTVKMENLEPLSYSSIDVNSIEKMSFAGMALNDESIRKDLTVDSVDKYIKSKYPSMSGLVRQLVWNRNSRALFDFLKEIKTIFPSCSLDLHSDNFMSRENGEIVVTDPFSTPYDSSTWRRRVMAKLSEKPNFNPNQTKFITQYDSDHRDKFISGKERVKFESFNSTLKIDGKFETATVPDDSDGDSSFETEKTVLKSVQIIPFQDSKGNEFVWYARQSRYSDNHWEVAFGKVKSFAPLTGYQLDVNPVRTEEYFKILSTVIEISNRFVQYDSDYTDNSVHTVSFTSKGDNRTNLYVKRMLPRIEGFELENISKDGNESTITLKRTRFW